MDSPLSIFSPDSNSYVNDEYSSSSSPSMFGFSAEDGSSSGASSSYSFASLSGLAEQLCSPLPPRSIASSLFPPPNAPSTSYPESAKSPAGSSSASALEDFFSFDLQAAADFSSSDDDFFTPTFSVTDLPSPSNYRSSESDYYPSTPSPPSFSLAPALKTGGPAAVEQDGCYPQSGIHLSSVSSWSDNQELCNPQEIFFPLSANPLEDRTLDGNGGDCWWQLEQPIAPRNTGKLTSKASVESFGAWDGVENVPEAWTTDETLFSSAPTWVTAPAPSPPSIQAALPTVHRRTPHRARSSPSIQPSTPRGRLPAKASMPALREEHAAPADLSYMFEGAVEPMSGGPSMFAVLGGYGGEAQSVGHEWDHRTIGGDMFGGGWEGGPNQRFEVEQQQKTMSTRLMAGFEQQQQHVRSVSSPSLASTSFPPSPSPKQHVVPASPARYQAPPANVLVTPPRTHRRPQPPPPSTPLFSSRPSTASSSSRPVSPPLLSSGPLTSNIGRKISPIPSKKASSSSTPAPAHLARAQAVVQLRQAEQDRERAEYQRTKASRKVDPFLASVLIQGWEPLATSEAALIVASTTTTSSPTPSTRPAPSSARLIAKLPSPRSSPALVRTQPVQRVQRPAIEAPIPVGGYTTFINYTMDDAESLLMGVAPSGAPQPRKTSAPSPTLKKKVSNKRMGEEMEREQPGQGKRRAT